MVRLQRSVLVYVGQKIDERRHRRHSSFSPFFLFFLSLLLMTFHSFAVRLMAVSINARRVCAL